MDVLELALYNSVLSGVDLEGRNFFYTNPLRQENSAPVDLRWPRTRVPFFTSFCCPPNLVRTIAGVGGYAYGKSEASLWVNLYGSNKISTTLSNGDSIRLRQGSNYPWSGDVRMVVEECGESAFDLKFRIPGWTRSARIVVNGEAVSRSFEVGEYWGIERKWSAGDIVDISFDMAPQLIEGHPFVEETRNHVAIKRGPIVYCLESVDLPPGAKLADVKISGAITLEPRHEPELLQSVTVLEGAVNVSPAGDWEGRLYREFRPRSSRSVRTRFIPYYAWSNRGKSEMSVWLPLD